MLTTKQLEKVAFEENLLNVVKYAIGLGLIVLLCLAVYEPIGKYWDMDNGDYKRNNMEVLK